MDVPEGYVCSVPVRCSCNRSLSHHMDAIVKGLKEGKSLQKIMDDLSLFSLCCRTNMTSQIITAQQNENVSDLSYNQRLWTLEQKVSKKVKQDSSILGIEPSILDTNQAVKLKNMTQKLSEYFTITSIDESLQFVFGGGELGLATPLWVRIRNVVNQVEASDFAKQFGPDGELAWLTAEVNQLKALIDELKITFYTSEQGYLLSNLDRYEVPEGTLDRKKWVVQLLKGQGRSENEIYRILHRKPLAPSRLLNYSYQLKLKELRATESKASIEERIEYKKNIESF